METENGCLRSTTNIAVIDVPVILIEAVIQVSRVCFIMMTIKEKVKVGFLYSATYTANQNSALQNLGSGS